MKTVDQQKFLQKIIKLLILNSDMDTCKCMCILWTYACRYLVCAHIHLYAYGTFTLG